MFIFGKVYILMGIRVSRNYMKRKIVLHGPSTLTVSIPANWARKFNVKKGDEVEVEEYDNELKIKANKTFVPQKKCINTASLKRLGKTYVTSSYRQGFDEILFEFDNSGGYNEIVNKIVTQELNGFEIIKQGNNSCLIKDLAGCGKNEFDAALRRGWLLTIDLAEESLKAIKSNQQVQLKNIEFMDQSINRFSNYCLRLLIKQGHTNFRKTAPYYYLVKNIEIIADHYKDLCKKYLENKVTIDKNLEGTFQEINECFQEFHQVFYKYSEKNIEELFKKTKSLGDKLTLKDNNIVLQLHSICGNIRNLLSTLVEINL